MGYTAKLHKEEATLPTQRPRGSEVKLETTLSGRGSDESYTEAVAAPLLALKR